MTGTRLKWLMVERDTRVGDAHTSLPLMSVSIFWGVRRRDSTTSDQAASEDLSSYKVCRKGDLVVNRMRAFQGALGIAKEDGIVSPDYSVITISEKISQRWLEYVMTSKPFITEMTSLVRGIGGIDGGNVRTPRLNFSDLGNILQDIPRLREQVQIADFLDCETAQLDTLIAKQAALIEKLRERRMSLINRIALQGYRPFSGKSVDHVPIGAMFTVSLGKMLDAGKALRPEDTELPYIRAANLQDDGLHLAEVNKMPFSARESSNLDLKAGDLLVVEGGAVGTSVLLERDMPGWSFQKTVNRVRTKGAASTGWLAYVLRAYRDEGIINLVCDGSTIPHLTAEKLRSLRIPLVTPSRQVAISSELDGLAAKIDELIERSEQFIALVRERRAALITAAVTGQLDVTKAA